MDQDGLGRLWSRAHCARWEPSSPPQRRGQSRLYCGQTAGCIKMLLGMKLGLSPGEFVLDGDPAPYPKRGGDPPNFRPTSIVAKRLHGSRCHLYGGRPRQTRHCVRCAPSYPRNKFTPTPTQFLAHAYCGQMAG